MRVYKHGCDVTISASRKFIVLAWDGDTHSEHGTFVKLVPKSSGGIYRCLILFVCFATTSVCQS